MLNIELKNPIKTSEELASIINDAKKNYKKYKKNPATKTFQAIRIFVNQELTELILGLIAATQTSFKRRYISCCKFSFFRRQNSKIFFQFIFKFKKKSFKIFTIKQKINLMVYLNYYLKNP